jgi:predicted Zn-dependent peptidase
VSEKFYTRQLPNGLTLLGQHMDGVSSAAVTFALPAGAAHDGDDQAGAASIISEWIFRGAGDRDTRQLNDALDSLGCQHSESVRSEHMVLSASQLRRNLDAVLEIYADIIRRPRLAEEGFEPCRNLTLQDLAGLEDEPARKSNILLREQFFPWPLGRCVFGHEDTLKAAAPQALREHQQKCFSPAGAMLAVAGNFDWDALCEKVESLFSDWDVPAPPPVETTPAKGGLTHIPKASAQVHICLAHNAPTVSDERYYAARMAETVLSGGMSSRLFTEVREKRGLVYHVSSRYQSLKGCAGIFTYAGSPPEKAQQTFDVTVGELRRLAEGIEEAEMDRARVQLKSSLIMQGESTSARSAALVSDWYHLGRLRGLDELAENIDKVTTTEVLDYLRQWPARDFTILLIGPDKLDTSAAAKEE